MASLREVADRYAARAQLTPGSELEDLTELIVNERPDVKRGSARAAARAALGLPAPAQDSPPAKAPVKRRAKRGRKVKGATRRGVTSAGLSGASSAGGIVAQALGLLVLYFVLTNASTAASVLASAQRAVEWVLEPVPLRR